MSVELSEGTDIASSLNIFRYISGLSKWLPLHKPSLCAHRMNPVGFEQKHKQCDT